MLTKTQEAEIVRLYHAEKWKVGTIARQLGIHHTTVRRVLDREGGAPVRERRPSIVDPYVSLIRETLEKYPKLPASRLFEMARERGYQGSPDHFRRAVAQYRPRRAAEAYLRLRTLPGEQAQVDWGHFGKLRVGRALRALMAFVIVLSWSRRIFLRFYLDARMPSFLHGHVSAFEFFGGVPRVLLYDNLKSAVLERRGDAVRFNPTLLSWQRTTVTNRVRLQWLAATRKVGSNEPFATSAPASSPAASSQISTTSTSERTPGAWVRPVIDVVRRTKV